jgi:hypothetical protein
LAARPDPRSHKASATGETNADADPCATVQVTIGPNVPHDVPGSMRLPATEQSEAELAAFAWQQFLALCWQSDYDTNTPHTGESKGSVAPAGVVASFIAVRRDDGA